MTCCSGAFQRVRRIGNNAGNPKGNPMNVRVEHCYCGNNKFSFRLSFPGGGIERITGESWSREIASRALDMAERLYSMKRANVRFTHG